MFSSPEKTKRHTVGYWMLLETQLPLSEHGLSTIHNQILDLSKKRSTGVIITNCRQHRRQPFATYLVYIVRL